MWPGTAAGADVVGSKEGITVDISTKNYRPIEMLALLLMVERVDSHTCRFIVRTMAEASDVTEFITGSGVTDLSP